MKDVSKSWVIGEKLVIVEVKVKVSEEKEWNEMEKIDMGLEDDYPLINIKGKGWSEEELLKVEKENLLLEKDMRKIWEE
jgi:hypothetical protein